MACTGRVKHDEAKSSQFETVFRSRDTLPNSALFRLRLQRASFGTCFEDSGVSRDRKTIRPKAAQWSERQGPTEARPTEPRAEPRPRTDRTKTDRTKTDRTEPKRFALHLRCGFARPAPAPSPPARYSLRLRLGRAVRHLWLGAPFASGLVAPFGTFACSAGLAPPASGAHDVDVGRASGGGPGKP